MKFTESIPGYEERFEEMVELLSNHPQHLEIHDRFGAWCDRNLENFNDLKDLEQSTLDYLESLCMEYGV